jgi:AAA domain
MTTSPITSATTISLAHISSKPLTWLWPNHIPLGHLTLLDAAPGSGLSLFTLALAACISRGTPLPDGVPTKEGNILLIAPYETAEDTILPRFEAAGGDPTRLILYRPLAQETPQTTIRQRSLEFPRDLEHLSTTITQLDARLVIIDPASSIGGLNRCLPALIELARHTNCAILLTRSLQRPPADPLRASSPTSPLLEAARSRLLLMPDPADDRHHLLLTTKHTLSGPSSILSYEITPTEAGIPILHWLGERDHTSLERLANGPIRSPHRQAILRFLRECPNPCHVKDILKAISYDYEPGRKMLVRMKMAGELVSPANGLYTIANHPSLATFVPPDPPFPTMASLHANVPAVPSPSTLPTSARASTQPSVTTSPPQPNVSTVPETNGTGQSPVGPSTDGSGPQNQQVSRSPERSEGEAQRLSTLPPSRSLPGDQPSEQNASTPRPYMLGHSSISNQMSHVPNPNVNTNTPIIFRSTQDLSS